MKSNSSNINVVFNILFFISLGVIYWCFYNKISINWKWYWDIITVCAICATFSFISKLTGSSIKRIIVSNFGLVCFALLGWYLQHMPLKWYWDVLILFLLLFYCLYFIGWTMTGKRPKGMWLNLLSSGGKSLNEGDKCPYCRNGQMKAVYNNIEKKRYLICNSCGHKTGNYS